MSQSYKASSIVRCPLCRNGSIPAHIGNSVLVCEACGSTFRVVHAEKGKTGKILGEIVKSKVKWKS